MTSSTRDRSPASAGHAQYISKHPSAPNNDPLDSSFAAQDPTLSHNQYNNLSTHSGSDLLGNSTFGQGDQADFFLGSGTYNDLAQAPILTSHDQSLSNHTYLQSSGLTGQGVSQGYSFTQGGAGSNHTSPGALGQGTSASGAEDSSAFPSFDFNHDFDSTASLDPSMLNDINIDPLNIQTTENGSMAAMQHHTPTPPHLLPEMARRTSNSPSPSASPIYANASFGANRPRNTSESLDPSSALFPQGQTDWSSMNIGAYRGHRRNPSDNYSDYSSHSNQASPYMPTMDSFDANAHSSPLLHSQDPAFNDSLGLQQFSLNDTSPQQQHPPQQSYHSPGHSPHISPRLVAQQHALPQFTPNNNFGMNTEMQYQPQQNGLDMFPGTGQEPFPSMNHGSVDFGGNADAMSPPEISINYAPPTQPVDNARPGNTDGEALSPPMRTTAQSRNRMRAKSDSYAGSRSPSPALSGRGRSPSLQPETSGDKLSPFDDPGSRSSSPGRGRNGSLGRGRSTSSVSDQRDYILGLAEPERTPSNGAKEGRVQKHPATFQCTLCPKRFTRAYNLRSHLRTHTDERPFVCTVCGKAFARQHDRKRHEGLHSGEKKFVCKGSLQGTGTWGCGRRFARADALGRHFRSEAGRVCIKPLLDEEAAERQKAWMEEQQQAQVAAGLVAPHPLMPQPQMDMIFPTALLQQYPALATINWDSMAAGNPPPEEDYSGRSSFDASSGGEYYDDMSENEMGSYPDPTQMGMGMQNGMGMPVGAGAPQGYGVYGGGGGHGDYLSDFEGR